MARGVVNIGQHSIEISNENKVLFPEDGITKGDIVHYYQHIAKVMLPLVRDHPLMMQRFPEGLDGEGFFQKNASKYFPEWIQTVAVKKDEGGQVNQVLARDTATLIYLAGQACVTPHIWLSRKENLDYPDRMIFDIDPGEQFAEARRIACQLRDVLGELGVRTFVMTTGSKGLHVVAPLDQRSDFDAVRAFAREVASVVAKGNHHATLEQRVSARQGRIYIDTLRNGYGQTVVAPYAIRAKTGAPIAAPIEWNEVERGILKPTQFTIKNIFQRLKRKRNPWADISRQTNSLAKARRRLTGKFAAEIRN
jgi:bifunctional non-homologous end joining protein LigD